MSIRKTILSFLAAGLMIGSAIAADKPTIPAHLQQISVTIRAGDASGSGVLFTRTNSEGQSVTFIWTAGHVVADLRSERSIVAADGTPRTVVEFKDASVVQETIENGRYVGRIELAAEVIRYSDSETGDDLALLRLRKQNFVNDTVAFYLDDNIPALGTDLYHVGSLLGQMGANSMTSGIYSQQGRLINKAIFDQTTCAAFPGSSGGGVFLRDGRYVGMLVRGAGETFNLIVPVRRVRSWARRTAVEWAIDPALAMPTEDALRKLPIEDSGKSFGK